MWSPVKLIAYLLIAGVSEGLNILGVFPIRSYSHFILGHRLFEELSLRGHRVTLVSAYDIKSTNKNYDNLYLEGINGALGDAYKKGKANPEENETEIKLSVPVIHHILNDIGTETAEYVLNFPKFQNLMETKNFDVIIIQQFYNDVLKAICHKYNTPCIALFSVGACIAINYLVENPSPVAYVPNIYLGYTGHMTFMERVKNAMAQAYLYTANNLYYFPKQNHLVQKYFPGAPDLHELNKVSIVLLNSHVSTSQHVPHLSNMIQIGGFHVGKPKQLPVDLQIFLDNATDGVIYFSLGSNLNSKKLPIENRDGIIKALSNLKMKVLWKYEDGILPGEPSNIKIKDWFPQQDILAHPNVKLFISHGGLLSMTESIYHGIPIIGIPFFADQRLNMALVETYGIGVKILFSDLNEKSLAAALNETINNPIYTENVKKRSKIMHDQPIKPMDNAIFWIEYAARHNGSNHFLSDALDITWYQSILLDVVLFIGASILIPTLLSYKFLKYLCSKNKKASNFGSKKIR